MSETESPLKGILVGLKASLLASMCCSLPVALALVFLTLGVGSVTAAFKIPQYKLLFTLAGSIFLIISLYIRIKNKCGGKCTINDVKTHYLLITVSIVSYVVLTLLIIYYILPVISELIFM